MGQARRASQKTGSRNKTWNKINNGPSGAARHGARCAQPITVEHTAGRGFSRPRSAFRFPAAAARPRARRTIFLPPACLCAGKSGFGLKVGPRPALLAPPPSQPEPARRARTVALICYADRRGGAGLAKIGRGTKRASKCSGTTLARSAAYTASRGRDGAPLTGPQRPPRHAAAAAVWGQPGASVAFWLPFFPLAPLFLPDGSARRQHIWRRGGRNELQRAGRVGTARSARRQSRVGPEKSVTKWGRSRRAPRLPPAAPGPDRDGRGASDERLRWLALAWGRGFSQG